jgi:predicted MFS family arabinose efflux permease
LRNTLMAGFRSITSDFNFTVLCSFGVLWNCIAAAETALVFMHLHDTVRLSAERIGVVYTALNLAGVPGAYMVGRLKGRMSLRALTGGAMSLTALGWLLVARSGPRFGVLTASIGLGMTGFFTAMYNVMTISYRQGVTPADLQGRVIATIRLVMWGSMPIGALLGGWLANRQGVQSAMTSAGCALLSACIILVFLRTSAPSEAREAAEPAQDHCQRTFSRERP